jgi:adenylosuccinate synthase
MLSVVVDGFFGDTGKGKIISYLAINNDIDIAVRGGVGPNAGHTVVFGGKTYKLRQIPSAFINNKVRLLIGPGVLVYPKLFLEEVSLTNTKGRTFLDFQCGIIESKHIDEDRSNTFLKKKIGTTGSGCGPAMKDRVSRVLKLAKDVPELQEYLTDVPLEVNTALDKDMNVLLEGTQGTFLSLYHGTYPYVTSKDVTAASICADVGVGPKRVDEIILVFKSYVTRVGGGPLENEYSREEAEKLGVLEIATVTGRVRRAAPFNFKYAKRAVMLNSPTQIAITKLDILFREDYGKKDYESLSKNAKQFIEDIENELAIPVTLISTGPDATHTIDRRKSLGIL